MKSLLLYAGAAAVLMLMSLTAREQEQYKGLKLFGYFFISTLGFKVSQYIIPTGIIFAAFLIYRTHLNRLPKILAAGFGLIFTAINVYLI
jgi:hypothetical protein